MNVYINCFGIHFQEQERHRVLALHQRRMIPLTQSVLYRDILHGSAVHKQDLFRFRGSANSRFADETRNSDPVGSLRLDFQQLFEQLRSAKIPDPIRKASSQAAPGK